MILNKAYLCKSRLHFYACSLVHRKSEGVKFFRYLLIPLREILFEAVGRLAPFWGLGFAGGVLIAEEADFVEGFLDGDGF